MWSGRAWSGVAGVGFGVALALSCSGSIAQASLPAGSDFTFTGAEQSYLVPSGVTMVHVVAIGGQGATAGPDNYGGFGGAGGRAAADLPVVGGQTLYVEVAGNGSQTGAGGFNGGGSTGADGGGGGGGSDIRSCSRTISSCPLGTDSVASRVLVAGGGGGGGALHHSNPVVVHDGGAGGAAGADGTYGGGPGPHSSEQGAPGLAGTESAGGAPGHDRGFPGKPGSFGAGGDDVGASGDGGGGGGGGWFGGGAGESGSFDALGAGGGGGSSFVTSSAKNPEVGLDTTGAPRITITPIQGSPTAATGGATQVGTGAATVNGMVNPDGTATTYRFEYGSTTAYGSVTPPVDAGGGTSDEGATTTLSGLVPNTTYHYRLLAQSPAGTSVGSDGAFKTLSPAFGGAYAPRQTADVARSGRTTVVVRCPAATYGQCTGGLKLTFQKGKTSTGIGKASFTIAAGARSGVGVRLSTFGRTLLRGSGRIKVLVTATSHDAAGTVARRQGIVTLARP